MNNSISFTRAVSRRARPPLQHRSMLKLKRSAHSQGPAIEVASTRNRLKTTRSRKTQSAIQTQREIWTSWTELISGTKSWVGSMKIIRWAWDYENWDHLWGKVFLIVDFCAMFLELKKISSKISIIISVFSYLCGLTDKYTFCKISNCTFW